MNIRIAPLPDSFLRRAREEGIDDQGQPVVRTISAEGGEPCRDVLRRARPGEALILASYSPFAQAGPYREFGPVFLLANPSSEDIPRDSFPANDYFHERLVLRAYTRQESIRDAKLVSIGDASATMASLLEHPDTEFVHARFPVYGCFALRVDRG